MENLLNYVNLRKDISFQACPFNRVDLLILADLAYMDWNGIIEDDEKLLVDACREYFQVRDSEQMERRFLFSKNLPNLVNALMDSERFKNIKMKCYREKFSAEELIQFGAITFVLEDQSLVVAYRGTDSSITGWKENLLMTHTSNLPCQILAKEYLENIVNENRKVETSFFGLKKREVLPRIFVTGHSKGGNLAMYAYLKGELDSSCIEGVVSFDGNGFLPGFWEGVNPDKIVNYIPKGSIIGRVLEHREEYRILDAREHGLVQHDTFNWSVVYNDFKYADELSSESDEILKRIDELLFSKSMEQRKEYTDLISVFFDKMEIYSISDMSDLSLRQALSGLKELRALSAEEIRFLFDIIRFIIQQSGSILKGDK